MLQMLAFAFFERSCIVTWDACGNRCRNLRAQAVQVGATVLDAKGQCSYAGAWPLGSDGAAACTGLTEQQGSGAQPRGDGAWLLQLAGVSAA